jgi:hypothetical protein
MKDMAGDAADTVKDKAGDVRDAVKDKAGDMKDAADHAMHSERAEKISDTMLDGAENAAKFVTPDKFDDKIDDMREGMDEKIGDDEARAAAAAAAAEKEKGGSGM